MILKNIKEALQKESFLFFAVFFKEVVGGAFKDVAKGPKIFKFDAVCLVIYHLTEVLITKPHLNIQPIFCLALFL